MLVYHLHSFLRPCLSLVFSFVSRPLSLVLIRFVIIAGSLPVFLSFLTTLQALCRSIFFSSFLSSVLIILSMFRARCHSRLSVSSTFQAVFKFHYPCFLVLVNRRLFPFRIYSFCRLFISVYLFVLIFSIITNIIIIIINTITIIIITIIMPLTQCGLEGGTPGWHPQEAAPGGLPCVLPLHSLPWVSEALSHSHPHPHPPHSHPHPPPP